MSQHNATSLAAATIEEYAAPDLDYAVLLLGSVCIALGAIFTDSIPVLIASMIIAPLSSPILLTGLGMARRDWRLIGKGLAVLAASVLVALLISAIGAVLLNHNRVSDIFISFDGSRSIAFGIAVIAGVIAAYGIARPKVAAASTGVAIAVSLMPPLVATGIGLAPGGTPFAGALSLFLLNVLGIALSSACTFLLLGVGRQKKRSVSKE